MQMATRRTAPAGRTRRGPERRREELAIKLGIEDGLVGFKPSSTRDLPKPATRFLLGWFYGFSGLGPNCEWGELVAAPSSIAG
jgi:hypothetical protein